MHLGDRGIFADRAAKDDVTVASVALARLCLNSVLCDIRREQAAQMRDRCDDVTKCDIRREERKDAQPSKWAAACDCGSDARDAMTRGDDENEVSTAM